MQAESEQHKAQHRQEPLPLAVTSRSTVKAGSTATAKAEELTNHFCASRPTRLLTDLPGSPTPATETLTAPASCARR